MIASRFRSDGGTLFGLVPKAIWQKFYEADANNLIQQNLNTWLIQTDDNEFGLLDLGCGDPAWLTDKQRAISGIDSRWYLKEALQAHGLGFDQIGFVILTHLHWDHAGGIGRVHASGEIEHTFPQAQVYIHAREWELATSGDPLLFKAYPHTTVAPLQALPGKQRKLITDTNAILRPGIRFSHTGGHTDGHCAVVFEADTFELCHPDAATLPPYARAVYAGDVCPTQHHLRLVYHMAYDTTPMQTRRWKFETLPSIAAEQDLLLFDHDPELAACLLKTHPKREITPSHSLAQITPHTRSPHRDERVAQAGHAAC